MTSTSETILSKCFLAASIPLRSKTLKYLNISDASPPITSTNSDVSLKGEDSKPRFLGEDDNMKPKSM